MATQHTQQPVRTPNNDTLKMTFWNIRGLNTHREDIERALQDIDVFIGVETHISPADIRRYNFTGFQTYRVDKVNKQGGGIIIILKNYLSFKPLKNIVNPYPTVELAAVEINNIQPKINLLVCYRAPLKVLKHKYWEDIIDVYRNLENCILVGDFNAHHIAWNCRTNKPDGMKLFDCIEKNIFLHNTDTLTHLDVYRGQKCNIDLVMSKPEIADLISVETLEETWGSDHYPLNITLNVQKTQYAKKSFKITSVQTNWEKLTMLLTKAFSSFLNENYEKLSPIEKYRYFIDIIITNVAKCTPPKKEVPARIHKNPVR